MKEYDLIIDRKYPLEHPLRGLKTGFRGKILEFKKTHAIVPDYDHWVKVAEEVNAGKAVVSVCEEEEEELLEVIELKRLLVQPISIGYRAKYPLTPKNIYTVTIGEKILDHREVKALATNEGLFVVDFKGYFKKEFNGAIVHFKDFKYPESNEKPRRKRKRSSGK